MIRRSLKDKELQYITANDVRGISSGSELEVLLASANQSNGYFLGHNDTAATSYANNTNIFSQEGEYAYLLSKGAYSSANINNFKFHLHKTSSSLYLYKDDKSAALTSVPTKTVSGLILKNTYNNVTRYLGVNGTSVTSTTDEMEAKFNEIYHWEMQYQNSSGRFIFHNPSSGRSIRYSGNSFSLNTSGTSLYVKYTSNAFTIAGSNTSNFMYMSSNTALSRTTSTSASQRLWTITQVNLLAPTCVDEPVEGLAALPTATVNNVLLRNTYNGTIRYLGMTTSNGVTSTTDLDTALENDYYRWNLVYYSSGRFKIQNAHDTSRYIRYSSGYSISTTSSNLYFKYVSGSGFTIAGASSTSSPYYMYMSGTTTLARSQNTAYYWDILVDKSSLFEGWVNAKALTIETATPNTTTGILAGYNTSGILTLGETCGSMSVYLNHGTSLSGLDYTKDKTDANCAWVLYDINKINHGGNGGGV